MTSLIRTFQRIVQAVAVALFVSQSAWATDPALLVEHAFIAQPPPGAMVAAGYMRVTNTGNQSVTVTGATCETFGEVDIHQSVVENGVARMVPQTSLVIAPGESVEFKHGSYHVMLMSPQIELSVGNNVELQLQTDAGPVDVSLTIMGKHYTPE